MTQFTRIAGILGAVAAFGFSAHSSAATEQQLLRCMDTQFEQGAYGQYYGMTYHGTDRVCGGDDLGSGSIMINDDGTISVELVNANHDPFVLYEVYWIPVGQDPVTHRVMVGNVMTDCNGNASNTLRDISAPIDSTTAAPVDIRTRVGNQDAGNFYFYSRGPWGFTDDGSCNPATYNTMDGTEHGGVANPVLWGGTSNPLFDGVQFISAYQLPQSTGTGWEVGHHIFDGSIKLDPDLSLHYDPACEDEGDGEKPEHCLVVDPEFDPNLDPNYDPNLDPNNQ